MKDQVKTARVFNWDTYPSDEVRTYDFDLPTRSDGSLFPPKLTLRLLDAMISDQIDQSPGEDPDITELPCGTLRLTASFGRLKYHTYWHPTNNDTARAAATAELAACASDED
jgi:hypothetical protein